MKELTLRVLLFEAKEVASSDDKQKSLLASAVFGVFKSEVKHVYITCVFLEWFSKFSWILWFLIVSLCSFEPFGNGR